VRRKGNGPAGAATPRDPAHRKGEKTVDTNILRNTPEKVAQELRVLEDQLRHELMPDEERQELRDRVIGLRRRLGI
jgi:hypothetical protein